MGEAIMGELSYKASLEEGIAELRGHMSIWHDANVGGLGPEFSLFMAALKEMMQMCSKEILGEAIETLCARLEEGEGDEKKRTQILEGAAETIKDFITKSLSKQKMEEQRQEENDTISALKEWCNYATRKLS
jgi:hypothetical protein